MMRIFGTASAGRPGAAPVSINHLSPLCLTFPILIQNQSIRTVVLRKVTLYGMP